MKPIKTLIVVRHGHAIEGQDDFARVLSPRGITEVRNTGAELQALGIRVDHIVSSSAPRAAETARELVHYCAFDGEIEQVRSLYLAHPRALTEVVSHTDDAIDTLLLVGHNPGLSTFVELLTDARAELGTAEMRRISLDISSWSLLTAT